MDAHKNFAYSTVLTAPNPALSGTSLVLAAGGGALMPAAPFNVTVWPKDVQPLASNASIERVTAIAGDTLTIIRTQEGSSAREIVVGDQVAATITAKTLTDRESIENKGAANGYASLDASSKVPADQLPSYVDDVLEYANLAAFPATGEIGKIYVTIATNKTYRWSGSVYVEIVSSPGSTDVVTEGSTNLYFTYARVLSTVLTGLSLAAGTVVAATHTVLEAIGFLQKQVSDHNVNTSNPHSVTAAQVGAPSGSGNSSGTNTGDQTNISGNAATVTINAPLTGVVTSTGNATAIADAALSIAKTSGLQAALDAKLGIALRFTTVTNTATLTINADTTDSVAVTAQIQAFTFANPTGTFSPHKELFAQIYSTAAQNFSFGNELIAFGAALPTASTAGKITNFALKRNAANTQWMVNWNKEV